VTAEPVPEELVEVRRTRLASALADPSRWRRSGFALAAYVACAALFWAFAVVQGASPSTLLDTMLRFSVADSDTIQQVLVRSVPIVLAALACTLPARAGLVNIGGEGQIIMGAVATVGVSVAFGNGLTGPLAWILMAAAGAAAGAIWAGICGWLRVRLNASESVSTLFFNFIANDIMLYLIFGAWRNKNMSGVPESRNLTHGQRLPVVDGLDMHIGVPVILVATIVVWWALERTGWGFGLKVAGGNVEAAYRLGIPVRRIMLMSMVYGGALAGLGGSFVVMGTEGALRPGMTASFGFIAFLANFLGGSRPFGVLGAGVLFSAIAMSGNGLQLVENLDGNAVNVLLGFIVLTTLVVAGRKKGAFE
jgi:simple sugar transport system permease protein